MAAGKEHLTKQLAGSALQPPAQIPEPPLHHKHVKSFYPSEWRSTRTRAKISWSSKLANEAHHDHTTSEDVKDLDLGLGLSWTTTLSRARTVPTPNNNTSTSERRGGARHCITLPGRETRPARGEVRSGGKFGDSGAYLPVGGWAAAPRQGHSPETPAVPTVLLPLPPPASSPRSLSSRLLPSLTSAHLRNPESTASLALALSSLH